MPSALPAGDPAPVDGSLPPSVTEGASDRAFGLYVHVPYCTVRCGYCDFNTYTAAELRGHSRESYPELAAAEMEFAARVMTETGLPDRALSTVFFGGGTPTLLGPHALGSLLGRARSLWGLTDDAEVTVEANPDTVTEEDFGLLRQAGVTRVSFGVQSTTPHVLKTLDRTHTPELVPVVIDAAKGHGLQVSVDLIYGTPGESLEEWRSTLEDIVALDPDHISAYALLVEEGTPLARAIKKGLIESPDDDLHADMYQLAEDTLAHAGYAWYEISNWAKRPENRSRHNVNYWLTQDWWGIGPGAHSHVGGVRWWNVKHPAAYAERIQASVSPALAREILSPEQRHLEEVLLRLRLESGIDSRLIAPAKAPVIADFIARGLLEGPSALLGQLKVTLAGRLLADMVARELT